MANSFASFGSDRSDSFDRDSRDYSVLSRYMDIIDDIPTKEDVMELSDEDREEIAKMTGNADQGRAPMYLLEEGSSNDMDEPAFDDERELHRMSFAERIGLNVVERLKGTKFRNAKDLLSFDAHDLWGNYNPVVQQPWPALEERKPLIEFFRGWLRSKHKTLSGYTNALLGEEDSEYFLKKFAEVNSDPESAHLSVEDLLGVMKEAIEANTRMPGRAWFQTHKLGSELLNHQPDDGRMEDESEDRGWRKNPDTGAWESTGYRIPYLRKEGFAVTIQNAGGEMNVLNICFCVGRVPSLNYQNLVLNAMDPSKKDVSDDQRIVWKRLLTAYRKAMQERDPKIMTCLNGKAHVYYRAWNVLGKDICVFSPIPFQDLREDIQKKLSEKMAKFRRERELWTSKDVITDIDPI